MKHTLSSFRRSHALRVLCILVLAFMCAPLAMAASVSPSVPILGMSGGLSPLMAGGVALGIAGVGLMSAVGDESGGGGGGEGQKSEDADSKLTIGQRLRGALASKADLTAKLDAEKSAHQKAVSERDQARDDLAKAQARVTELESQLGEVTAAMADHEKEVKTLQSKEQDIEKRAEAKAKEHIGSLGFAANKLPSPTEKVSATSYEEAMAEYSKLTDPKARAEYYQSVILPALNAKN